MAPRISDLTGRAREFAVACYETNNLSELTAPHAPADADPTDCREWGITADEWSRAIDAALNDRLADAPAKTLAFAPLGGANWSVTVDGREIGTINTSDSAPVADDGACDMEAVEAAIREQFHIGDDVRCPEYPY